DVARDHQDHEPARDRLLDAERDIDRDDHRLVGERIEISAEFRCHAEALGRKPSMRSLSPATRNTPKAICIWFDAIAQTMTGTSRMRASVMRLGILKPAPRLMRLPVPAAGASFHPKCNAEYSGERAIAQSAIPKYRVPRCGKGAEAHACPA